MTNKFTIQVSEEDIKKGEKKEPECCPIALALDKKGFKEIYVGDCYLDFEDEKGDYHQFMLPNKAMKFISCFDKGENVSPFEFTLGDEDLEPTEYLREFDVIIS
jgi:hypothetical protein